MEKMNSVLTMLNAKGKKFNLKKELSKEVRSTQEKINVEEFPQVMQTDDNMGVFIEGSMLFKQMAAIEAKKDINSPEYKLSVKNMNTIKQSFEKIKNDLYFLADYKTRNWDNVDGISRQEDIDDIEFLQDLVLLPDELDRSVSLHPEGSTIMGPRGNLIAINNLPKLTPASVGKSIEEGLNEMIQQEGINQKQNGKDFNAQLVRSTVKQMLNSLRDNGGIKAIKSAGYDAIVNVGNFNGSFMDHYFEQPDIVNNIKNWMAKNPGQDPNNIKDVLLPNMWNHHNSNQMEKLLEDFYVFMTQEAYDNEQEVKPQINTPTAGMSAEEKLEYYRNLPK
tara:strand:+ start:5222 stop:6223 length:1002 start_codon:yes stop_codon:yes gene_type:complete